MAGYLLRSTRQLYSSSRRYILQPQHYVVPVRFYAKESASKAYYNETMKGVFSEVKDKLETTILGLQRKMKCYAYIIAPEEGMSRFNSFRMKFAMVQVFNKNYDPSKPDFEMKLTNEVEKLGKLYSTVEPEIEKETGTEADTQLMYKFWRYAFMTRWRLEKAQDARTRLKILMDIYVEDWARPQVEAMFMAAVDKVEEQIKKPLKANNIKGYDLLRKECFKIVPRLAMRMIKEDAREVARIILFQSIY